MRDHGGDIDRARKLYGGAPEAWLDLSTGINRAPYPVGDLPASVWTDLPTKSAMAALVEQARTSYGASGEVVVCAGAQQAIQMMPWLLAKGRACILSPTYNEHRACLDHAGWQVEEVRDLQSLAGADLAVVVNPNNPDGQFHSAQALLDLLPKVGRLIVDESFIDPTAARSIACESHRDGLFVLRSFGKFYGLAGLRLGFVLCAQGPAEDLRRRLGPWPVAGAALHIGKKALADHIWQARTANRLKDDVARMDAMVPWPVVGGDRLFRLYDCGDAALMQAGLAGSQVWSRIFPWSPSLIRLGLPGNEGEWQQFRLALDAIALD